MTNTTRHPNFLVLHTLKPSQQVPHLLSWFFFGVINFETTNVSRIETELQKTIDMIEDQEIVAHGQENANVDVDPHA